MMAPGLGAALIEALDPAYRRRAQRRVARIHTPIAIVPAASSLIGLEQARALVLGYPTFKLGQCHWQGQRERFATERFR